MMGVTREEKLNMFIQTCPHLVPQKSEIPKQWSDIPMFVVLYRVRNNLFGNYSFKIMINQYNLNGINFIQTRTCKIDCSSVI